MMDDTDRGTRGTISKQDSPLKKMQTQKLQSRPGENNRDNLHKTKTIREQQYKDDLGDMDINDDDDDIKSVHSLASLNRSTDRKVSISNLS